MYAVDLGQCAVQLFQGYAGNERNGLDWNGKGNEAVTEKNTSKGEKNVVLKNGVFLAFISDSGFETQQKAK